QYRQAAAGPGVYQIERRDGDLRCAGGFGGLPGEECEASEAGVAGGDRRRGQRFDGDAGADDPQDSGPGWAGDLLRGASVRRGHGQARVSACKTCAGDPGRTDGWRGLLSEIDTGRGRGCGGGGAGYPDAVHDCVSLDEVADVGWISRDPCGGEGEELRKIVGADAERVLSESCPGFEGWGGSRIRQQREEESVMSGLGCCLPGSHLWV